MLDTKTEDCNLVCGYRFHKSRHYSNGEMLQKYYGEMKFLLQVD